MGSTQQFSLKWNKYRQNWDRYLLRALSSHLFSDVMVACDGEVFQLHRVVLASCSAYFEKTLQKIPPKETPIVMLSDVSEAELRTLIEFMYCGEATIDQSRLESLLKAAERLQIRGLVRVPADGESSSEEEDEERGEEAEEARRIEHRQAAAAALASRAPWPAQRAGSPSAGRRSPVPHSPPLGAQSPPSAGGGDPLDVNRLLSITVDAADSPPVAETPLPPPPPADMSVTLATEPRLAPPPPEAAAGPGAVMTETVLPRPAPGPGPTPAPETPARQPGAVSEPSTHGGYKRNTSDSPHVQAAVRRIADGELTVAEASIEFDVPIPTLYLNMRRQGVKARGRLGMTGKRKPRTLSMSQEMRNALSEIESGAITASKASRKYNITLPRIMSWMRKMGVTSAYSRTQRGAAPPETGGTLPAI